MSKDDDFYEISLAEDGPPKVVVLRVGNVSTSDIEALLRRSEVMLQEFYNIPDLWICELRA